MDNGSSRTAEVYEAALAYWQAEAARYRIESDRLRSSIYSLAEYAGYEATATLTEGRYEAASAYADMSNRVSAVITEMTGGASDGE